MKLDTMHRLGLSRERPKRNPRNFGDEYLLARQHFRTMFQFQFDNLTTLSEDAVPLNPEFVNCTAKCFKNMENYMQAYISGKKCSISCLSSPSSSDLDMDEVIKTAKKKLRILPAYMRGDISARLSSCDSVETALEILYEIEDVFWNIDYSLDSADGANSADKT